MPHTKLIERKTYSNLSMWDAGRTRDGLRDVRVSAQSAFVRGSPKNFRGDEYGAEDRKHCRNHIIGEKFENGDLRPDGHRRREDAQTSERQSGHRRAAAEAEDQRAHRTAVQSDGRHRVDRKRVREQVSRVKRHVKCNDALTKNE